MADDPWWNRLTADRPGLEIEKAEAQRVCNSGGTGTQHAVNCLQESSSR